MKSDNTPTLFTGEIAMVVDYRKLAAVGCLVCVGAMAFALYLQYGRGEEPCPLCIFQRIAMIATGTVFLLAALHKPRRVGRWIYAALAAITALIGVALAARHVWLQSLPPGEVPACGPTLTYLLRMLPVTQVVQLVLKGDGSCAAVTSRVFGVTLPVWTLAAFSILTLYALVMPVLAKVQKAPVGDHH